MKWNRLVALLVMLCIAMKPSHSTAYSNFGGKEQNNNSEIANKKNEGRGGMFSISWFTNDNRNYQKFSILQAEEQAKRRQRQIRNSVKSLLLVNGGLMLYGGKALESLIVSMLATKIMHMSSFSEGKDFMWTLVSWSSLFLSGTASIFGWVRDQVDPSKSTNKGRIESGQSNKAVIEKNDDQKSMISWVLILGSRGTELVGGTFILFSLFLSL
jgi:hypothetical protein